MVPVELLGQHPTSPRAPLTDAQREILGFVACEGAITPTDAGLIVHAHRRRMHGHPNPTGCPKVGWGVGTEARQCCRWCSTDGASALKRLERRGLIWRTTVGLWEPVS